MNLKKPSRYYKKKKRKKILTRWSQNGKNDFTSCKIIPLYYNSRFALQ